MFFKKSNAEFSDFMKNSSKSQPRQIGMYLGFPYYNYLLVKCTDSFQKLEIEL